jgi:purine catabolism regulator
MLTVDELLAVPELELRRVHMADGDTPVRWVATSELSDPTPFLEGAEILLTTGVNSAGRRWGDYVARLKDAGVAALGLATGLTYDAVPAGLVRACRAEGLNLFDVPRATTFVSISRETARLLDERRQESARDAASMQRALTQAALAQDSGRLLRRLADLVDGWVCTVGADGQVEVSAGSEAAALDADAVREEVARLRPHGLRASRSIGLGGTSLVVQPIGLRGRPESWLVVSRPGRLEDAERSAVTTAVALLSLAAETVKEQRSAVRALARRALELLVRGDERSARVLLAASSGDSADEVHLPGRVCAVRATGAEELLEDALSVVEQQSGVRRPSLVAIVDAELWCATPPSRMRSLTGELQDLGLHVGVGDSVPLGDLAQSHEAAALALAQTSAAVPVVRWQDVVGQGPLPLLRPEAATAYSRTFLAPLGRQRTGREALVRTLASFVRHNGSRGEVAADLGLHRNTVRHRIEEIEAALERSLDDPQTRASAWLALQIDSVRHYRP